MTHPTCMDEVPVKRPHHPAMRLYLASFVLLLLMVLLGFIAVFVPWAMKDIAVNQRAWAYPFKTCIQDVSSTINLMTCMDNDFIVPTGVPLTGGASSCKAFILATIAFVFINVLLGVVILLVLLYVLDQLWNRPLLMAVIAQCGLVIVCIAAFLAWIFFIVYANMECAPNSIFPVQGYSYGFILYIFATALAIGAVVTGFMGLRKVSRLKGALNYDEDTSPESPVQPVPNYPEYPVMSDPAPTMSFAQPHGQDPRYPTY